MREMVKKLIICSLIIVLMSSYVVILSETIANALEVNLEDTNVDNVKYDVFIKREDGRAYETEANVSEIQTLVVNVRVKNQGVLKDAKIKIENANFNIIKEIENEYVKSIENNEIELNQIIYSNEATIEIPIEFNKVDRFTEDYFDREIEIKLTGTYENEVTESVNSERKIKLNWTGEIETAFIHNIEKYMKISDSEILVQQNICTAVEGDYLPRNSEIVMTKAQEIDGRYPKEVIAILNGLKLEQEKVEYNNQDGNVKITNTKTANENGEMEWGSPINEYNIIYIYETEAELETKTIELSTTIETNLFTRKTSNVKEDTYTLDMEETGNVVEIQKEATRDLYKGYMYANSNNETQFVENNTIKISKASAVESIEINNQNEVFIDLNDESYNATSSMIYKSTIMNKRDLERIFGLIYEIKILDIDNKVIANITETTECDEKENITINYDGEVNYLKIVTSKPENEGNITITNTRAVKGITGYTKEELKSFSKMSLNCMVTNGAKVSESRTEVILNDTVTEATIEVNDTNLSAVQTNQDVQFMVTLRSNDIKYDLYKKPTLEIILPQELEMNIKTAVLLNFEDEIQITNVEQLTREDGKKVIRIETEGEQRTFADSMSGGIQIVLIGDINVTNLEETREDVVQLLYTNENSDNEQYVCETPITLNARPSEIDGSEETSGDTDISVEPGTGDNEAEEPIDNPEENEELSLSIKAKTGDKYLKDGDTVLEGQGIKYTIEVTNNTDEDMQNIVLEATNTNAIYYNMIEYQDNVYGTSMTKYKYIEDDSLTSKELKIEELKAGETKEVSYQISIKEVNSENEEVTTSISVSIDNKNERTIKGITNKIGYGQMKLNIEYLPSEDIPIMADEQFQIRLNIENIGDNTLNDVIVEVPLHERLILDTEQIDIRNPSNCQFMEYDKNNTIKFKIAKLNSGEKEAINIQFSIKNDSIEELEIPVEQFFISSYDGKMYISNEIEKTIFQNITEITAVQTTNVQGNTVKDGQRIQFIFNIENKGKIEKGITIDDVLQLGLNCNSAKIIQKGEEREIDISEENVVTTSFNLEPKESVEIIIEATVEAEWVDGNKIRNSMSFTCPGVMIDVNTLELIVEGNPSSEPTNPDNPDNPGSPETNNSISGVVWVDKNRNGNRENTEPKLSEVPVFLIDIQTQDIAKNGNGNEIYMMTDSEGRYQFNNLKKGKYFIIVIYDTEKYTITEYQKEGISKEIDSDVLASTINIRNMEIKCAKTKEIDVQDSNINNIDAGLVEAKKFDLRLDKYVNRIEVQNNKGTRVFTYNREKLAKVEIEAKNIAKSKVIIEYVIEVTNEGEVPGYANEIVDYMPSDLKFDNKLNPKWQQSNNSNLYTKELENQVINPGETKRINLILTKDMTQENTGRILNKAEISKHYNEYMLDDIDSVPLNKTETEDDMSSADVIISIKTGKVARYILLISSTIVILAGGIYLIKKCLR